MESRTGAQDGESDVFLLCHGELSFAECVVSVLGELGQ